MSVIVCFSFYIKLYQDSHRHLMPCSKAPWKRLNLTAEFLSSRLHYLTNVLFDNTSLTFIWKSSQILTVFVVSMKCAAQKCSTETRSKQHLQTQACVRRPESDGWSLPHRMRQRVAIISLIHAQFSSGNLFVPDFSTLASGATLHPSDTL